ncbi:MAG: hypothetical protein IPJ07_26955 [Acidobacteria bacterium]|nr:hypothetical protein [Acidobacteriota bacterium]
MSACTRLYVRRGCARRRQSVERQRQSHSGFDARFYQKMLKDGQPPAAALRSAQIEMWKQKNNGNHPITGPRSYSRENGGKTIKMPCCLLTTGFLD